MKKIFALIAFSVSLSPLYAQSDDFGLDFAASVEKRLAPGLDFGIEGGARTQDNTRKMDRWTVGTGISYKFYNTKTFDLKAGLKWEYMWVNYPEQTKDKTEEGEPKVEQDEDGNYYTYYSYDYIGYNHRHQFWRGRHRTSVSLSASYKPNKRWSFSLKETFQYTHFCKASTTMDRYRIEEVELDDDDNIIGYTYYKTDNNTKQYKAKDKYVLRSKLTAAYNIRHCPIDPYASAEYGCGLHQKANKWKFTAGADIKLSLKSKLDIFYRYQTEDDDDDPNGHIIGIGYNFKF